MKTLYTGEQVSDDTLTGVNITIYPRLDVNKLPLEGHGVHILDANEILEHEKRQIAYEAGASKRAEDAVLTKRKEAYGTIEDQLDQWYWDQVNGTTILVDHITAVKAAHPKGE